ncbi:HAD family hydrolase [Lentzea tibetensis]|uniref:HAD family hydrolase n=1 Tax=Lentzea tibetensis TaxID=2591470 RepID=A0A563EQX2_9PSEU|nr:HAD family hydrolase [Lentzea tibetensis]TWP50054.1 HAD family hydrolase [Lentzea tibetensis]
MALTVGFDLDMTLIDPRPGMAAVLNEVATRTGYDLDGEHFAANLGPPLDMTYREMGVPEEEIPELVTLFRSLYPELVIPNTVALPGAAQALAAVRELGGRTMVVTGKYRKNAALHLEALGWEVDHLFGELWSTGKAEALKLHGASVYVGDHVGDVHGAKAAGALAVGVLTGPCSGEELAEAGADVVLADLTGFPAWLSSSGVRS